MLESFHRLDDSTNFMTLTLSIAQEQIYDYVSLYTIIKNMNQIFDLLSVIMDTFFSIDCLQNLDTSLEIPIYGAYLLEMALKDAIWQYIHTTINFQAFRRLKITCVQLTNVPL